MTSRADAMSRRLPRGWGHFLFQIAIWLGFYVAYQAVRGHADRNIAKAFTDGRWIISTEQRLHTLVEPSFQRVIDGSGLLIDLTTYTYWLSQFAVVGIALIWIYFRQHPRFADFRNTLVVANLLGLVGYWIVPTAPPRLFPSEGFQDTLALHSSVNHHSGLVLDVTNQYAAMPSLHSMDAIIVGVTMAYLCRNRIAKALWLLWAPWVWFTVMSTGNHYWLDVAVGVLLAGVAAAVVHAKPLATRFRPAGAR
jgi:membrane-associated phospholipid phosphatase